MKRVLVTLAGLGFALLLFVAASEYFTRTHLLTRSFSYFEVTPERFPTYRLVSSYTLSATTIHNRRREKKIRGKRDKKVAIIGDSVAFCARVGDHTCFTELLQGAQQEYDIYNLGVPGYGIPEVLSVLDRELKTRQYEQILYLYNFNDVHVAMPVLLSLLSRPEHRLSSLYDYGNTSERWKGWLKDYLKFPFALKYMVGTRFAHSQPNNNFFRLASQKNCFEQQRKQITEGNTAWLYHQLYPKWQKIYRDRKVIQKLSESFRKMNWKAIEHSSKLTVVPFHDSIFFYNHDQRLNNILLDLLDRTGVHYLNTYPLQKQTFSLCEMYADPGHPYNLGNWFLAKWIKDYLLDLETGPVEEDPDKKKEILT